MGEHLAGSETYPAAGVASAFGQNADALFEGVIPIFRKTIGNEFLILPGLECGLGAAVSWPSGANDRFNDVSSGHHQTHLLLV
jgi:hypothetical protein